jgi:hypothetical protein
MAPGGGSHSFGIGVRRGLTAAGPDGGHAMDGQFEMTVRAATGQPHCVSLAKLSTATTHMETTAFVSDLKHTLWDIKSVGGNPGVYVAPNHRLLRTLRKDVFEANKDRGLSQDKNWRQKSFFEDVLSTDRFERRIRYCIITLREFEVPEEQYFDVLSRALRVPAESRPRSEADRYDEKSFKDALVEEVSNCFDPWYYPTELQCYDTAQERQLARFDHRQQAWQLSNLGSYLLDLPTFEAIVFLCALEIVLGRRGSSRYLNAELLVSLLDTRSTGGGHTILGSRPPRTLRLFGVVEESVHHPLPQVTDIGRRVLSKLRHVLVHHITRWEVPSD